MSLLSFSVQTVGSVVNQPSGGRASLVHDLRSDVCDGRTPLEIETRDVRRGVDGRTEHLTLSVPVGGTPGPVKQNTRIDLGRRQLLTPGV